MPKATEGTWWVNGPGRDTTLVRHVKSADINLERAIFYGEGGEIVAFIVMSPGLSVSIDPNQ